MSEFRCLRCGGIIRDGEGAVIGGQVVHKAHVPKKNAQGAPRTKGGGQDVL